VAQDLCEIIEVHGRHKHGAFHPGCPPYHDLGSENRFNRIGHAMGTAMLDLMKA
jgi:hypothetical protein